MVRKNIEYTVTIEGYSHDGQGVAKIENFVVFVEGALKNELVRIKVIKVSKNYAVGKLLEVINPSCKREEAVCPVFGKCGGCTLMHMNYEEQLEFKRTVVEDALKRIGGIETKVQDVIGCEIDGYRNKAMIPVKYERGNISMGFFAKRSHRVIETEKCHIQSDNINRVMNLIKELLKDNNISIYDENTREGIVRNVLIREGFNTGEIMIVFVINGDYLPKADTIVDVITREVSQVKSICININKANTNVVIGKESKVIYQRGYINEKIEDITYKISPESFFQVNTLQVTKLYKKVLEFACVGKNDIVYDIYCGTGSITLFLAKDAKHVYGIESNKKAVSDAVENAKNNGIENATFITGKAEEVFPEMYQEKEMHADVVVIDPPRSGCDKIVLDTISESKAEKVVYVSCNPSTLARDLNYLKEKGYEVRKVQPVDMFKNTYHVETVCLLSRR